LYVLLYGGLAVLKDVKEELCYASFTKFNNISYIVISTLDSKGILTKHELYQYIESKTGLTIIEPKRMVKRRLIAYKTPNFLSWEVEKEINIEEIRNMPIRCPIIKFVIFSLSENYITSLDEVLNTAPRNVLFTGYLLKPDLLKSFNDPVYCDGLILLLPKKSRMDLVEEYTLFLNKCPKDVVKIMAVCSDFNFVPSQGELFSPQVKKMLENQNEILSQFNEHFSWGESPSDEQITKIMSYIVKLKPAQKRDVEFPETRCMKMILRNMTPDENNRNCRQQ